MPTLELTAPAVARGWEALKRAKAVLGEVERIYRAFAAAEPVFLVSGKMLGEVTKTRESIDGAVALRVLTQLHGAEVAQAACEVETSKAAIKAALKPGAKRGTLEAMFRAALDAIGTADGISTKRSTSVEEH